MTIAEKLKSGRMDNHTLTPATHRYADFTDGIHSLPGAWEPLSPKQYYIDVDAVLEEGNALN